MSFYKVVFLIIPAIWFAVIGMTVFGRKTGSSAEDDMNSSLLVFFAFATTIVLMVADAIFWLVH